MDDNIVQGYFNRKNIYPDLLAKEIIDIIYSYSGKMSISEALGALEIAKYRISQELLD